MVAAALADGTADRDCVFEVFARRLPHGRRFGVARRHRPVPGGPPPLPVRRRRARAAARAGTHRRAAARLAGRLPVQRRHRRLRRGRPLLPRLAGAHRPRALRRGRAAGDPRALGAQPRQRDRLGRGPHGRRRLRAAVHRDGLAAHPRGGRGRRRPRRVPGRASRHAPTSRPAGATASRRPAPARTPSRCCTTTRRPPSARRSPPSGPGRRCWSTPTTSTRASARRSRSPAPSSAAIRLDSGDLPTLATHARELLDSPRRHDDPDRRHQRPRRVRDLRAHGRARRPLRRRHVARHRLRAPRRSGMVYKLVERDGVPVAKKSEDKVSVGGRKYAVRRHDRRRARRRPRWSAAGRSRRGTATGDLVVPLVRGGRCAGTRRPRRRWPRPGRTTSRCGRRCRRRRGRSPAASRSLETVTVEEDADDPGADRGRRAERLLRGRQPRRRRGRGGRRGDHRAHAPAAGDYAHVVATRDHHIDPGAHFAEHPDFLDTWPAHCVVGTDGRGAAPGAGPRAPRGGLRQGRARRGLLGLRGRAPTACRWPSGCATRGVDAVDVVGIATDHCVRATALDAVGNGFATRVLLPSPPASPRHRPRPRWSSCAPPA